MRLREHSDSDLVAALATAGREDGTTGTRTHAQAEAMLLVTLAVVRLESALHDELRWFWGKIWTTVAVKGQTVRNCRYAGQTGDVHSDVVIGDNPTRLRSLPVDKSCLLCWTRATVHALNGPHLWTTCALPA